MIIKRKYACYYQLMEEQESREILLDSFKTGGMDEESAIKLLKLNGSIIVCNTDMGSCIPGSVFIDFMDRFDKLDKMKPFDNGFTYNDVAGVLTYTSRRGNAMTQVLYSNHAEMPKAIVQVIAFEHNGNSIKPIEPWDIKPIIIG